MADHALVLVSCSDDSEARRIARRLVEDGLAAGVQRVPINSIYTWESEIVEDEEVLLLIKTRASHFEALRALVSQMHSYEVPQVVMVDITAGHQPYLDWISDSTL